MARKSEITTNPIRVIRLENKKSLETFSNLCGVHLQALYLNEQGMYPTILPSILRYLVHHTDNSSDELEELYQDFVKQRRYDFGDIHSPYDLGPSSLLINPLHQFRTLLDLTTAFGFAKAICLNPTTVRRVEKCLVDIFPGQLRLALRDIQLPVGDIEELEYRHQEYFHSGLRSTAKV